MTGRGPTSPGLDALVEAAIELAERGTAATGPRTVLGIVGAPGAGKSTLAEQLLAGIRGRQGPDWAAHLPMDGFHLADAQLNRLGLRHRKGAPETFDAAGYAHALHRVRAGEPDVYVPGFERDVEQPVAAALVIPAAARLVVTEGNYLLLGAERWAAARAEMDQVWFVTGDEDVRLRRLVARHVQFGKGEIQAREWVAVNDEPNAVLVHHTMPSADLVVENSADGWLLVR